jgi:hypothetical protein
LSQKKYDKIIGPFCCHVYDKQYNLLLDDDDTIVYTEVDLIYGTEKFINLIDCPDWVQEHFTQTFLDLGIGKEFSNSTAKEVLAVLRRAREART